MDEAAKDKGTDFLGGIIFRTLIILNGLLQTYIIIS